MTRVIEVVRRGRQGRAGVVNVISKFEELTANTALLNADFGSAYRATTSITVTLPVEVDPAWTAIIDAFGGDVTLTVPGDAGALPDGIGTPAPSGNINDLPEDLVIQQGFTAFVFSDGTNFFARFYFSAPVPITDAASNAALTAADREQTGLDRVQTGLDRVATGQDAAATAADRVQTGQDRTQTGLDAAATAADRVQTGLDAAAAATFNPALYVNKSGDALTGGFTSANDNDGAKSGGTYTPVVSEGNYKAISNAGAFTLAAPAVSADRGTTMLIVVTNNASAGAVTFTGFDAVKGDLLTTTNGHRFLLQIAATDVVKTVSILALQ